MTEPKFKINDWVDIVSPPTQLRWCKVVAVYRTYKVDNKHIPGQDYPETDYSLSGFKYKLEHNSITHDFVDESSMVESSEEYENIPDYGYPLPKAFEKSPRLLRVKDLDSGPQRCISNGNWVLDRGVGYSGFRSRLKCAWLVFTGKADALTWPGGQ